eukprot:1021249-Rhodomonas_salina.1
MEGKAQDAVNYIMEVIHNDHEVLIANDSRCRDLSSDVKENVLKWGSCTSMHLLLTWASRDLGLNTVTAGEASYFALRHVENRHVWVDPTQSHNVLDVH